MTESAVIEPAFEVAMMRLVKEPGVFWKSVKIVTLHGS